MQMSSLSGNTMNTMITRAGETFGVVNTNTNTNTGGIPGLRIGVGGSNTNSNTNTNTNTNTTGGGSDIGTVLCAQGKKAIGQAEALAAEQSNWIDVRTGILADRADGERSRLARSMQVSL